MLLPVLGILRRQRLAAGDLDVLRILVLGGLGIIERAADDDLPIDDDDLIMGNGMLGIDQRGDPRIGQEIGRRVFVGAVALVEDGFYVHAAFFGIHQSFRDG